MKRSRELIKQTEEQLRQVLSETDYKLESMDGISTVTAAELIAEIGDIRRFSNADKLARFAEIAPVTQIVYPRLMCASFDLTGFC